MFKEKHLRGNEVGMKLCFSVGFLRKCLDCKGEALFQEAQRGSEIHVSTVIKFSGRWDLPVTLQPHIVLQKEAVESPL